ncbi:hypothetical protein CCC_00464 [Paramagnetospirillum magnetotacticum MS-1]|uniref:Uncharacterized protein n=1 Tax=Paramagnetospirillum magnetotacticum MS-1 TaxID=272627 RepID=A0A0C2YQK5_PARME|nr:hypothetical protein [Paramagnetospirillum magnetotacticum]KIL97403.1 hypothetical protein CCC_00464 [Paramagnetospirillum magnetotacticum MS-1]
MADIQWNRYINRLCDLRGDARFDDMLIGCIAAFHAKGRSSDKQGDWLVRQLDMHYGIQVAHQGAIQLTKEQRRPIRQAVDWTNTNASSGRMAYLHGRFPHAFHTVSTSFPHGFHTKGANSSVSAMTYPVTIARLLLKLIDAPLAFSRPPAKTDGLSAQVDGGSPVARHQITEATLPIAVNTNVIDDAASPLRGFAAKSDEPFHQGKDPKTANANWPMGAKANRPMGQVKANSQKANISLWVDGGSRSHVRGRLEVGDKEFRLNFRTLRRAEELIYVEQAQGAEARQWYEAISGHLIPSLQAKADAASGRLPQNHVASAVHEVSDTHCQQIGLVGGFAFLSYRGEVPSRCIVQINDTTWQFELQATRSPNAKAPQFKATAEPSSLAA